MSFSHGHPMGDPAIPCVLIGWLKLPFPPGKSHTATLKSGFGSGGDQCCLIGDWNSCMCVDSKQTHCIDALMEVQHVGVDFGFADLGLVIVDVCDKLMNGDAV